MKLAPLFLAGSVFFSPAALASWRSENSSDEMRGTKKVVHYVQSDGTGLFGLDGRTSVLFVTKSENNTPVVAFTLVGRNLFNCASGCKISYKLDDGPVESRLAISPHSYTTLAVDDPESFVRRLLTAKTLMIEMPIYSHGKLQYKFDVSNFPDPAILTMPPVIPPPAKPAE
jgi:hypothetical protein